MSPVHGQTTPGETTEEPNEGEVMPRVFAKQLGDSATILLSRNKKFTRRTTVTMSRLLERNGRRRILGFRGGINERRSFFSLRPLQFNFSELVDVQVQSVKAKKFNFTALVPAPNATLNVMVFLFVEPGNITIRGETLEVNNGTLAFSVEVCESLFCNLFFV